MLQPIDRFYSSATRIAATRPTIVVDHQRIRELGESSQGTSPYRIERDLEEPQVIKFSGGSTGVPKPVVQSMRCVNAHSRRPS